MSIRRRQVWRVVAKAAKGPPRAQAVSPRSNKLKRPAPQEVHVRSFDPPKKMAPRGLSITGGDRNRKPRIGLPASLIDTLQSGSETAGSPRPSGIGYGTPTTTGAQTSSGKKAQPQGLMDRLRSQSGRAIGAEGIAGQRPTGATQSHLAGSPGSMRAAAHVEGAIFSDQAGKEDE